MMSVDQKLRDLKDEYQSEIPTSFTEKDKQTIFKTISQDTYPKRPKLSHYFQKPAALVSYAAVIALIGLLSFGQLGLDDTASPHVSDNHPTHEAGSGFKESNQVNIGGGSGEQQLPSSDGIETKVNFNSFSDSLTEGSQVGSMTVSKINQESNRITFTGDIVLSGTVVKEQGEYKFHVNDLSKSKLPFTEDHEGMMIVDFENIDVLQDSLQKVQEESYIKFIISEYHYRSMGDQNEGSITVNTIIQNGDYKEVNPQ